jgi:hypothetical protein
MHLVILEVLISNTDQVTTLIIINGVKLVKIGSHAATYPF